MVATKQLFLDPRKHIEIQTDEFGRRFVEGCPFAKNRIWEDEINFWYLFWKENQKPIDSVKGFC